MLTAKNPWAEKSRALDAYRYALLRQRHGRFGSALRFFRDAVRDTVLGGVARFRLARSVIPEACDFLLLQSAPKVVALNRKAALKTALRDRGHRLTETALPEARDILCARQLLSPPHAPPLRYFLFAAHAEWLCARHAPKILLNDRNGSLYSPFLRLSLHRRGGQLVQLAHAATLEKSSRLSMNDYDYYFLFGQSSLEALRGRALRFGDSNAVLAGSHMVDQTYALQPATTQRNTLLILGVGPDKEKEAGYQKTYALLRDWLAEHPEIPARVKAHPRSSVPFWREAAKALPNLSVLPAACTLAQALGEAGVVINIMSNAVIEAAQAARPVLVVNLSGDADIFQQERFFGAAIGDKETLSRAFARLQENYSAGLEQSAAFVRFHLEAGAEGLRHNLELLERLLRGEHVPCQALPGKMPS